MGVPAKRRFPPQWSKCRCVLITHTTSRGIASGSKRGDHSASSSGVESDQTGVNQHAALWVLDHVQKARPALALDKHVAVADRTNVGESHQLPLWRQSVSG